MKIIELFSRSARDQGSFEALLAPHIEALYRLAYRFCGSRHDAEDLVQELLVKLYPRRAQLAAIEQLRPWLARSLYHLYVDHARRTARAPVRLVADGDDPPAEGVCANPGPEALAEADRQQGRLGAALARLNEDQRLLVMLHDVESYTLAELEQVLDTPVGTLKSRLHRARARLRELLGDGTF